MIRISSTKWFSRRREHPTFPVFGILLEQPDRGMPLGWTSFTSLSAHPTGQEPHKASTALAFRPKVPFPDLLTIGGRVSPSTIHSHGRYGRNVRLRGYSHIARVVLIIVPVPGRTAMIGSDGRKRMTASTGLLA